MARKSKKGSGILDVLKNPIETIKEAYREVPSKYNYVTTETLKNYGNNNIININIARTPLNKALTSALDVVSMGKFNELIKKEGYDKLYHLSLIATLNDNTKIIIEKNEVPYVMLLSKSSSIKNNTEYFNVQVPNPITLNQFIDNGLKYMGDNKFFGYNYLSNNCQLFVKDLLFASHLLNDQANKFIYQDFSNVQKSLSNSKFNYVNKVVKKITNLGSIISRLTGRGTQNDALTHFHKYIKINHDKDITEKELKKLFIFWINNDGLKFL